MILKSSVESRKAALALDAPDKAEKDLLTNQVNAIFSVSPDQAHQCLTRLFRAQLRFLG